MRTNIKIDPNKIWFTADLHFFHENIIQYCNRPWKFADEMNKGIVSNWNSVVKKDDKVFVLGDIAMGGISRAPELASILKSLNGEKFLVPGNHDTYLLKSEECLKEITVLPPLVEISIPDKDAYKGRQNIVLCHYALKVWNGSHKGSWSLYGHSHHSMPPDYSIKAFDVGIDGNGYDYKPISYARVKDLMLMHSSKPVDHHNSRTN